MVADVTVQLHHAAQGSLQTLRARTRPQDCVGGATFAGARISADAYLVVDGLLIDFKGARRPLAEMSQRTAWQLTGYPLLDTVDRYRIDTVGLYLTRSGVRASWPVDDYLALLGACRRELTELRGVFAELLAGCRVQANASYFATDDETERVRQLLQASPCGSPVRPPPCARRRRCRPAPRGPISTVARGTGGVESAEQQEGERRAPRGHHEPGQRTRARSLLRAVVSRQRRRQERRVK
ncbi:hypothetical protein [Streptomyces sp. Agncl-13]|uniref:hypothetical protein n=1 Tax=Streptomyces sp. Agncl-13 TaxID=3400628 RepID=UPI003A8810F6